jgi:CubicO group peptidase (beta-lactamase class C family)
MEFLLVQLRALGGLAAIALLLAVPFAAIAQTERATPDMAAIEHYVAEQRDVSAVPGLSIVITRGGEMLRAWGEGADASGAPMSADTPVYIGSASKAFTALAVMQLVEVGRIDLDAPAHTYLPEFRMRDPRAAHISVRQILQQTSGMADIQFQEWTHRQPRTLQEAVALLSRARLARDPGVRFSYHNPNYYVAARLVEIVSGETFADYLDAHIFAPLGMAHTSAVNVVREREDGAPLGHIHAFGQSFAARHPGFFIAGAGGVLTTASDMGRWLTAQANGGVGANGARVLSEAGLRVTHAPSDIWSYGLGWNTDGDGGLIRHSGGLATYSAYVAFTPGGDGVAMMIPAPFAGAEAIAKGVLDLMAGRTPPERRPSPMGTIDFGVAFAALLVWALGVGGALRARRWAARMRGRRVWRVALSFAPQAVLIALILFALPFAVSRVESWSWVWLAYYVPVWVALFASIVLASALAAGAKLLALVGGTVRL